MKSLPEVLTLPVDWIYPDFIYIGESQLLRIIIFA